MKYLTHYMCVCVCVPTCAHIQAMEYIIRVIVPDRVTLSAKEIPLNGTNSMETL